MIQKRSSIHVAFLSLFLLVTVGCSAFHEVSVVSLGDEGGQVKDVAPEEKSLATSDVPELEQDEKKLITPVPITSTPVPPPTSPSVGKTPFSRSAEDLTLPWTVQDIFFDFDQMAIRKDAIPILEQNAKVLLKRYPSREVLIQGHCDERGTEEYNLILGDRRASAVKNYLVNLGVAASRLRVLSLGKSQPFCLERTTPCFQSNRRAHFVLK
ncbi:MAG: OmpA family protein [Nitrospirales bacterium]